MKKKRKKLMEYEIVLRVPCLAEQTQYVEAHSVAEAIKLAKEDSINNEWDYNMDEAKIKAQFYGPPEEV